MKRFFPAALALIAVAGPARAHFVFAVPDGASAAKVVFSDSAEPDDRVDVTKIASTKLFVADAAGVKPAEWELKKEAHHYAAAVPGEGARQLLAVTDYGVLKRGEGKAFRLQYHAKAVFGPIPAEGKAAFAQQTPIEFSPLVVNGKLHFQALLSGKPLAKAEFAVRGPGDEKASTKLTDEQGLTPGYDKPGTYAARVLHSDPTAGQAQGKDYAETRHYATAVVELPGAKPGN